MGFSYNDVSGAIAPVSLHSWTPSSSDFLFSSLSFHCASWLLLLPHQASRGGMYVVLRPRHPRRGRRRLTLPPHHPRTAVPRTVTLPPHHHKKRNKDSNTSTTPSKKRNKDEDTPTTPSKKSKSNGDGENSDGERGAVPVGRDDLYVYKGHREIAEIVMWRLRGQGSLLCTEMDGLPVKKGGCVLFQVKKHVPLWKEIRDVDVKCKGIGGCQMGCNGGCKRFMAYKLVANRLSLTERFKRAPLPLCSRAYVERVHGSSQVGYKKVEGDRHSDRQ